MNEIKYINGDATEPTGDGAKFIIHCCNDEKKWGAGFVLALSNKWKEPEQRYRSWKDADKLGLCQFVKVEPNLFVVNMIGQRGVGYQDGLPPVRYDEIEKCLATVGRYAKELNASVHGPRFCCGLAGAEWDVIEEKLKRNVLNKGVDVTIYDFE